MGTFDEATLRSLLLPPTDDPEAPEAAVIYLLKHQGQRLALGEGILITRELVGPILEEPDTGGGTGGGVMPTAAPTVTASVYQTDRILVEWTPVAGAAAYEVWEAATAGRPVATITAPATSRLSGPLVVDGRAYTYSVRAVAPTGEVGDFGVANTILLGGASSDVTAPSPITDLAAVVNLNAVTLSHSAATDDVGVARYAYFRGTAPGFTAGLAFATSTTPGFVQTGVAPGTYYYRVVAYDAAGNSAGSNEVGPVSVTNPLPTTPPSGTIERPVRGNTGIVAAGLTQGDLTPVSGTDVILRTDGEVITNRYFPGKVTVLAKNVRMTGCKIERELIVKSAHGFIGENLDAGHTHVMWTKDWRITRLYAHGLAGYDAIQISSDGTTAGLNENGVIERSFLGVPILTAGAHYDCMQLMGVKNLQVLHNNLTQGDVLVDGMFVPFYSENRHGGGQGVLVKGNWVQPLGHYHFSSWGSNLRYVDNILVPNPYPGVKAIFYPGSVVTEWTNNRWSDTGALVTL